VAAKKKKRKQKKTRAKRVVKEHPLELFARRQEQAEKNDPRLIELRDAAAAGDVAEVRRLLKAGLDPSALPPDGDDTALIAAVYASRADIVRLLIKAGADVNDGWPSKPLGIAAGRGDLEVVRALIAGGADVHLPDDSGDTPLDEAVDRKHLHVIAELLGAGADPNFVSDENRARGNVHSPLERAAYDPELLAVFQKHGAGAGEDFTATLLLGAIGRGDLAEVKRLVNEEGADVNAAGADRQFPLHLAASMGKLSVVKFLLAAGAKVNNTIRWSRRGPAMTALDLAKQARQKKVVEYLLGLQKRSADGRKPVARGPTMPRPTGVPTFSVNDTSVLVESPVDQVAAALARHVGASIHGENVLGETVTLTRRCFAVFRIVDQPWSIVMRLNCADVRDYLKPRDGAALSKVLRARAIVVTAGKTSGIYQYITFDRGEPFEVFDVGSAADDTDRASIRKRFIDWYGVDLAKLANVDIARGVVFASSLRKPNVGRIKHVLEFISESLKRANAFVPFWGDSWGGAGERVELTLEGLGPDDIERLDYVGVTNASR
jgi:ankyrin repeat protein